jgi:hypothetical protein
MDFCYQKYNIIKTHKGHCGRDSSVLIAIHYRLDGLGIKSGRARFSAPIQTGSEAHPTSSATDTESVSGCKATVVWR